MSGVGLIWREYWYYPAALAALLLLYAVTCVRAMGNRAGTLEWIERYDQPARNMPEHLYGLTAEDILPMAAVCLTAGVLWGGWYLLVAGHAMLGAAQPAETAMMVLGYVALPIAAAGAAYLLSRRLFGSVGAAVLSGLAVAMDLNGEPVPMAVSALALLATSRCFTADRKESFGDLCPSLLAAFAVLAAGCYFDGSLALMTGAVLLLALCAGVCRFVQTGRGWLLATLLTAVLTTAVTNVVLYLPAALLEGMAFPQLLVSPEFYEMIARRLLEWFHGGFQFVGAAALLPLLQDLPLVLAGTAALLAAFIGTARQRDSRGLLLLLSTAGAAAMLLLCFAYVLPLPCALGLGYVWHRLSQRGHTGLATGGAVGLLLMMAASVAVMLYWFFV